MVRNGKTISLSNDVKILSFASAVGKKEANGPLKEYFDIIYMDTSLGQKSFERAESMLQARTFERAINKAGIKKEEVDLVFAGDLLNQCIGSSYALSDFEIPFCGLYGACSTMAQALAQAAIMCECGAANVCAAVTSSHFCSAERQFRFPLNYGGQRTPTSQWTVSGAGALIVGKSEKNLPLVKRVCFGKICDLGVRDINNMGAAMAPAAADTLMTFFEDTGKSPEDFDLILTGDLGKMGSELMYELLLKNGVDILKKHNDCGLMIYDIKKQDAHCGGSGAGCSASVLCSKILSDMLKGKLRNILFVATGALMSTVSVAQGASIPAIAHLVEIENGED